MQIVIGMVLGFLFGFFVLAENAAGWAILGALGGAVWRCLARWQDRIKPSPPEGEGEKDE